jgi:hypothetical protein
MPVVVLVAVDLAGLAVLFPVDLGSLRGRKFAAVGLPVSAHLLIDSRLIFFEMGSLSGGQLATLDPLGNAILLILLTFANFALGIRILHGSVVLILVDLPGNLILLLIQRGFICGGQFSIIQLAHVALFLVDTGFFLFQIHGLTSRELSTFNTVGDAVLLVFLAVLY